MIEPFALPVQRGPKQTLHHVWAPKLRRIVMLTGQDQLRLWVMLEAHPHVTRYCERPAYPDTARDSVRATAQDSPIADFWAVRDGAATLLRLEGGEAPTALAAPHPTVELISASELQRHSLWIRNWLSLLPYLSTSSPTGLQAMTALVAQAVAVATGAATNGMAFDEIERHFAHTDPMLTRTAIINALHAGLLISEDLQLRPWDRSTRVSRASPSNHHASQ